MASGAGIVAYGMYISGCQTVGQEMRLLAVSNHVTEVWDLSLRKAGGGWREEDRSAAFDRVGLVENRISGRDHGMEKENTSRVYECWVIWAALCVQYVARFGLCLCNLPIWSFPYDGL